MKGENKMAFFKWKRSLKRVAAAGIAAAVTVTSCPLSALSVYAEEITVVEDSAGVQEETSLEEAVEADSAEEDFTGGEVSEAEVRGEVNKARRYEVSAPSAWIDIIQDDVTGFEEVDYTKVAKLRYDLYVAADADFEGNFYAKPVTKLGSGWTWTEGLEGEGKNITCADFAPCDESETLKKYTYTAETGALSASVAAAVPCVGSGGVSYEGYLFLDNVALLDADGAVLKTQDFSADESAVELKYEAKDETAVAELKKWSEKSDFAAWEYDAEWNSDYDGAAETTAEASDDLGGSLKLGVDFSANAAASWSQMAVKVWDNDGMNLAGANKVSFDFYYEAAKLTTGGFSVKAYSNAGVDVYTRIDTGNSVDAGEGINKASVALDFNEIQEASVNDWAMCLIGQETNYKGNIWFDNITISSEQSAADEYVDRTVAPVENNSTITVAEGRLTDATGKEAVLPAEIRLADKDADDQVKKTYAYLKAIGDSDSAIFGHQNDTWHKAGSKEGLSDSDVYDVTGAYAGIVGIDTLSLTGNEYSASRYNSEIGDQTFPETASGNVAAAAALTNRNIENGSLITLSAHMPNFAGVKANTSYQEGEPSYAKYMFEGYTPNDLSGSVMQRILPGGELNEVYNAYLDMIADYASRVNGAVLFRPFHENTGSWFWWGAASCEPQTYRSVWKYTVEYLRDTKDVHNFIYVYGPGSEAANVEEYALRYPGDGYVDMVGFDMYHSGPKAGDTWFENFKKQVEIVETFAKNHNKLFAVTETGVANETQKGDNQTALLKQNNEQKEWYTTLQNAIAGTGASYFLVWANFGVRDGFYTPYVTKVSALDGGEKVLHGHEMMDHFVEYYNDARSVFAADQKAALNAAYPAITVTGAAAAVEGYIASPIAGTRILKPSQVMAKISGAAEGTKIEFVLKGEDGVSITVDGTKQDNGYYMAEIDREALDYVGSGTGSITLTADGTEIDVISVIFNEEEPEEDPYLIDDFEDYFGQSEQLTKKWAANKASGSSVSFTLTKEKAASGYAMKFDYDEAEDGWGGATLTKEVDWSGCNALSFYTVPDGNNQKIVIQITANGHVYEAYLQEFDGYRDTTAPMKVTIPFDKFVSRDNDGPGLKEESASIQSFGVWVNAIKGTPAVTEGRVKGSILYDDITAVKTDETEAVFLAESSEVVTVLDASSIVYTGKAVQPKLMVKSDGILLREGIDYKVKYTNNVNAGNEAKAIVTGKKNYKFKLEKTFTIVPKSLAADEIEMVLDSSYAWNQNKAVKVAPVVSYGSKKLKAGKDYRVIITKDGKEVAAVMEEGNYQLKVQAVSPNYKDSREADFTVTKKTLLKKAKIRILVKTTSYDGTEKKLAPEQIIVKVGNTTLENGKDYEVSYKDNTDAGTAAVIITAKADSEYSGTKTAAFKIIGTPVKKTAISGIEKSYTYTGSEIAPVVSVSYRDTALVKDSDYEVSYEKNTNAGTALVKITGKKGYSGTVTKKFKIMQAELTADMIAAGDITAQYSKKGAAPDLTLSHNGIVLTKGMDYTLSYKNNKQAGAKASISVKGTGNYKGILKDVKEFIIVKKQLSSADITYKAPDVQLKEGQTGDYVTKLTVYDSGKKLKEGKDYVIESYVGNSKDTAKPATAEIRIKAAEGSFYDGSMTACFRLAPHLLNKASVTIKSQSYNGSVVTLAKDQITVKDGGNDVSASNYKIVSYSGNDKAGVASVTLRGKGEYAGEKTVKFVILPKEIKNLLAAIKSFF